MKFFWWRKQKPTWPSGKPLGVSEVRTDENGLVVEMKLTPEAVVYLKQIGIIR